MKSLLIVATSTLVFATSATACPYMDKDQKVTDLEHPQQEQSLVENDSDTVNSDLLLLLDQKKKHVEKGT